MMRTLLLSIFGLFSLTAISQSELVLRIDHTVGNNPLEQNVEYTEPDQGYNFSITRLQYYVSEIEITHDGGQKTLIEDTWLLVDALTQTDYSLGSHNISSVEAVTYSIGVDEAHNHLDPTQYEEGHPLAPQNPAMHWGWAAGYRFVCLEGKTGMNLILTYQIHALGDDNYFQLGMETGAMNEEGKLVIPVIADYMGMYKNIDVSGGLIEHSETGVAVTLLENISNNVYSPTYFTGVNETSFKGSFAVGPNPSTNGTSRVLLTLPSNNHYQLSVFDITGKQIQSEDLRGGNYSIEINPGQPGIYFVRLSQNGSSVSTEKLVVTR